MLSVLFPLGPKQLEFTATFPVEALWLRPRRVHLAEVDLERVANRLIQTGLDLTRDVRIAYAESRRALERVRLANEAVSLLDEIANVAEARVRAGEVSAVEGSTARIELLRAKEEQVRAAQDVTVARTRLVALLGTGFFAQPLELNGARAILETTLELDPLIADSLAARPDLRAAELAVAAACHRAELARVDYLTVAGLLDANGEGTKGFEAGHGLQITLPIFHRNDGAVARAIADIERTVRRVHSVQDQIQLEVRESYARYEQARQQRVTWHEGILPEAEQLVCAARKSFEDGDASYIFVLESTRHLLDARVRAVESEAGLRRSLAELERNVGRRLDSTPSTPPLEMTPCMIVRP